jgi:hypothetical protein
MRGSSVYKRGSLKWQVNLLWAMQKDAALIIDPDISRPMSDMLPKFA